MALLDCQQIRRGLHHAELRAIACRAGADAADVFFCKGVALTTVLNRSNSMQQRLAELFSATDASLTGCMGGIAETGTLVLWPSIQEPRLLSLVPPIHAVVLEAERIRSTFHEFLVAEDWVGRGLPTNALLISGPSKSADIEQTLAYGVHGPKELLVLVRVKGETADPHRALA